MRRQWDVARVTQQASIAVAAQELVWQATPRDAIAGALLVTLPCCLLFLLLGQSKRVLCNGILQHEDHALEKFLEYSYVRARWHDG